MKWLKLNYKNTGFYAVHYKDESWAALGEALSQNVSVLTQEDRASLVHNIFALSKSVSVVLSGYVLLSCFIFTGEFRGVFSNSWLPRGTDRFGRVSFLHVLNLLDYMVNETETSPVKEALLQLNTIYRLLDKRQEHGLVARMKVRLSTAAEQSSARSRCVAWFHLTRTPLIPLTTGLYAAPVWFFDKQPNVERGGTCV